MYLRRSKILVTIVHIMLHLYIMYGYYTYHIICQCFLAFHYLSYLILDIPLICGLSIYQLHLPPIYIYI